MTISKLPLFFILFALANHTYSQQLSQSDSTKLRFTISPIFGFDRLIQNQEKREIHAPEKIIEQRDLGYNTEPFYVADKYVDYPQTHWSFFGGANMQFDYKKVLSVNMWLIGENQSSSAGVLGFDQFTMYPRLILNYNEDFKLFKRPLTIKATIGDLIQFRNRGGLLVYNIDGQGGEVGVAYSNVHFSFLSIADLSQHIGLNIQEWFSYKLGYSGTIGKKSIPYDAGVALDVMAHGLVVPNTNFSFAPALYFKTTGKKTSAYAEVGIRNLPDEVSYAGPPFGPHSLSYNLKTEEKLAAVVGIEGNYEPAKKHKVNYRLEARYYGRGYTKELFVYRIMYRDGYGQYQGEHIYPLMNAYRPYNQFAVYSEFQDINITSINAQVQSLWTLYKRLKYRLNLELLILHTLETDFLKQPYLYTFYETGLVFKVTENIEASAFVSNRVMNLDLSYQTHYQSKVPLFGYAIRSQIPYSK